jgi:PAS domain S-box-containing protein
MFHHHTTAPSSGDASPGNVNAVTTGEGELSRVESRLHAAEQRVRALEQELRHVNASLRERAGQSNRDLETSAAQLIDTERRFHLLVDAVTDYAIFMLDAEGRVVNWNRGAERIKGYGREEIIGQHFSRFYTATDRAAGVPARALSTAALTGKYEAEGWRVRKNGNHFWASVIINAIYDANGAVLGFAKVTRDLTERRNAEEQLRQAQKMEALGQLTGGVAHDFNNMLQVILGNINLLQRRLAGNAELESIAAGALRGVERAALLVQRLLAFSRRQALEPRSISVNALISGMSELMRRTLGESIVIETVLAGGLWHAFADSNQLENSLLNLAINARDAMPNGGKLTIEAANVFLDEHDARGADLRPGQYVGIFVSDNGQGMSAEVASKAFDPFFTTKEVGQGTGLGLSQVYGFIKQSGGHVRIYSEKGLGTTVKLYLPRHIAPDSAQQATTLRPITPAGRGDTILVVEDDADVRCFTAQTLHDLGYTVVEAANGQAALDMLEATPSIRLLFTDVGLPGGMNGRHLADFAKERRPDLKVLFTSGYARSAIVHHGRLDPGVELIGKPFTFPALAERIHRMLRNS